MNKFIKKIVCIVTACTIVLSLTACGNSSSGTNGKTPAPADITAKVMQQVKFAETEEITSDRLSRFYTVDSSSVDKMSLFVSTSLASADEVCVFVGKNAADTAKIKAAVEARITKRGQDFNGYNATEYAKVQKSIVEVRGNYVFFAVCVNPSKAQTTFDSFFK